MSTLKATNLQHASAASPNIVLDSSGNATMAGSMAMATPFAMKNKIINGAMEIDQRNAGASVTPNNSYALDRWCSINSQTSKFTIQQNAASVTPPAGFIKYLGATSSSAYSVASGETFNIAQHIEGLNVADLGWGASGAKTVTLSFWARSSLTGTFGGCITNSAINYSYPFTYSIPSANTWTSISVTIPGPTAGTWLTDTGVGVRVLFGLGVGSSLSGTAGSWASAGYYGATGATSVVGTNGATFYLTGVQLEVGSVATPFERRLYPQELAMCQRYYEKSYDTGVVPGAINTAGQFGFYVSGASSFFNAGGTSAAFAVEKRATPTVTSYSAITGTSSRIRDYTNNVDVGSNVTYMGTRSFFNYAAVTQASTINIYYQWTASAEL